MGMDREAGGGGEGNLPFSLPTTFRASEES